MKPFSMEPVLQYRKQLEDVAQQKLFTSLEQEATIQTKLLQAEESLKKLYTNLTLERNQGTTVDRLLLFENRIPFEQKGIVELQAELDKQKKVVDRRRRHLLLASQDRKALEKLKERKNIGYKKYLEKKEATMLDEIAVLRYGRND